MSTSLDVQWGRLFELADQPALPLQARLRSAIVRAILDGRLDAGASLPSSRELSGALGISRNTVTAAYVQLVDEGFLQARARTGVFVAPDARPASARAPAPVSQGRPAPAPEWSRRVVRSLAGRPTLAKPER